MRFYLDTCSLNRPWDDQSQGRVHLEAEAVLFFVSEARPGRMDLVTSGYLLEEIQNIAEPQRRADVAALTEAAVSHVSVSASISQRSKTFAAHNIRGYDALHIAAAEAAGCHYFFTTDDRLLKRARPAGHHLKLQILNPADWPPQTESP